MKKSFYVLLVSLLWLSVAQPSFATIDSNAVVVGNAAKQYSGRTVNKFSKGIVRVYNDSSTDQSELLSFVAYGGHVGVQVATGDVNGDGTQEIVTLPYKSQATPVIKIFNLDGELVGSFRVPIGETRLSRYVLAVGEVTGDDQDEIILANAGRTGLLLDVLTVSTNYSVGRLAHYDDPDSQDYRKGVWVEVANINRYDEQQEIVTAPMRGAPLVDLWAVDDDTISSIVQFDELVEDDSDYAGGLHIAAYKGYVIAVKHSNTGTAHVLKWIEAKGNLNETNDSFAVGKIGNISYNGEGVVVSALEAKTLQHFNDAYEADYSITGTTFGPFVDFLYFPTEETDEDNGYVQQQY